jgi:hypothetical protein
MMEWKMREVVGLSLLLQVTYDDCINSTRSYIYQGTEYTETTPRKMNGKFMNSSTYLGPSHQSSCSCTSEDGSSISGRIEFGVSENFAETIKNSMKK